MNDLTIDEIYNMQGIKKDAWGLQEYPIMKKYFDPNKEFKGKDQE